MNLINKAMENKGIEMVIIRLNLDMYVIGTVEEKRLGSVPLDGRVAYSTRSDADKALKESLGLEVE